MYTEIIDAIIFELIKRASSTASMFQFITKLQVVRDSMRAVPDLYHEEIFKAVFSAASDTEAEDGKGE